MAYNQTKQDGCQVKMAAVKMAAVQMTAEMRVVAE